MSLNSEAEYKRLANDPSQNDLEDGLSEVSLHGCRDMVINQGCWARFITKTALYILLISLYTGIILAVSRKYPDDGGRQCRADTSNAMYYSPAQRAMTLHSRDSAFMILPGSKFAGNPSPEVDQAWKHLLKGTNMRISQDTLTKLNRSSIELADGSGDYWGSLEVYHHLHCLKTIRQYIAVDYYGSENIRVDKPPGAFYPTHIEHCIERLREYLMCVPDLTIYTYDWLEGRDDEPMPNHYVKHACVDWGELEQWVEKRRFSYADKLIRRSDGTVWPDKYD